MRIATIVLPEKEVPLPVAVVSDGCWVGLADLAGCFILSLGECCEKPSVANLLPEVLPFLGRLTEILKHWPDHAEEFEAKGGRVYSEAERILPPVPRPPSFRDFYAFEEHVKTARSRRGLEMIPAWYEIPTFYFSNTGSLIGDEAEVAAPAGCQWLDYELELGVVIGKSGRDIAPEKAWEHVAGFTIINDLSARDLQRAEMAIGLGPAKGKDFATAVGPHLITIDELEGAIDGEKITLEMVARVNGRELSRGNSASLYHSWPQMIAHASRDAQLFPGDLLGSGTVGTGCILELGPENTGGWLKPGDVVELEIERLGCLRTKII